MIREEDLQEAIAECKGQRNPTTNTAIKLAAFLTIKRELFGNEPQPPANYAYSYAEPPKNQYRYSGMDVIGEYGESDFLQAVAGKDPAAVWKIVDELMETLKLINKHLYDGVLNRLQEGAMS